MNTKSFNNQRLNRSFFSGEDVVAISKALLGKYLVTNFEDQYCSGKIVETEAYRGPDDKACHAYNNLRTKRTETMYQQAGTSYVYLCYGIHHLFNIVTAKENMAHAILIRAIEPVENVELMLERRQFKALKSQLTAGPGVMSKALGINKNHNGLDLCSLQSPIWLESRGLDIKESEILSTPRVGVAYAKECALWPWRFRIKGNKWTSPAK